jgi:type IV conjugative transfer system coupling protein TraD
MILGMIVSLLTLIGVTLWLKKRGETQTEHTPIKGDEFASKEIVANIIIKRLLNSDLLLAGLPLILGKETRHFLFHGTVGSGKSNAIKELLEQIRRRGDRAVIYDKSCNLLEEFYCPDIDILLNSLDVRGRHWSMWRECRDSTDFDSYAAAQIPMPLSTQDPFWIHAARTIFSAAAYEMRNDPDRSVIKLLRYLLTADLDVLQKYLKGTEAETLVSEKAEKTAISIKSVLATYLKSMKYIQDEKNPFSIREWIQDEKANNWLFITSLADRHESLKPLISAWLDIAVNALMSLPPSQDRRIWLILDELPSLQQLPYLTSTLSESRKFGGCIVIGAQNYAQIEKIYGQSGAREISALLNTRFMFRQPDPDMAKWSAENFGESIIEEVREGISYGANTMRDGISINRVETRKPLINFSEIMSLDDLHAYVRLPGKFPVTTVQFQYKERELKNPGIVHRNIDALQLKEVDELIEKCEISIGVVAATSEPMGKTKWKTHKKSNVRRQSDRAFDITEISDAI